MTAAGPHRLLFYDYVEGILELRPPHREAHLARIGQAIGEGGLLAAGAAGCGAGMAAAGASVPSSASSLCSSTTWPTL